VAGIIGIPGRLQSESPAEFVGIRDLTKAGRPAGMLKRLHGSAQFC
jgi:hypothetical protein